MKNLSYFRFFSLIKRLIGVKVVDNLGNICKLAKIRVIKIRIIGFKVYLQFG